eukprot:TRINITY_DN3847_c0_g2_i1.p1 TRINITY_DN3847_c0_g2~~TRINITY_DN3847_c0_g2_i1.p1  ORF type:complete len:686 (+),score=95.82 TRINITY_DN3847_c0_g2_i1:211-2268(+)
MIANSIIIQILFSLSLRAFGQPLLLPPEQELIGPMDETSDLEQINSLRASGVLIDQDDLASQMFASELLPEPFAFFPLTGEDVSSVDGLYSGSSGNVTWIEDDRFGLVPFCDQDDITHVITLDSVPYYLSSEMAVNFWFKAHNITGEHFQYIFSHSSMQFQDAQLNLNQGVLAGWSPNQFNVFIPEYDHLSHGILRVLMKDANDVYLGRRSQTWVDSDGQVGINTGSRLETVDPADGRWHMATVTTRSDGRRGYQMYLDGDLAGEMEEGNRYLGPGGDVLDINGGDAILLDGNIVVCGRADRHPERDFQGSVVYLSLFDTYLTAEQIAYMYQLAGGDDLSDEESLPDTRPDRNSTAPGLGGPSAQPEITFGPSTVTGEPCMFPYQYEGQIYEECITVDEVQKCKVESGEMVQCVANVVMPTSTPLPDDHPGRHDGRFTVTGQECQFPSLDGRVLVFDCVERDGADQCQTEGGFWEECLPKDMNDTTGQLPTDVQEELPVVPTPTVPTAPQVPVPSFSVPSSNTGNQDGPYTVLTPTEGFTYLPLDQDVSPVQPNPTYPTFNMPAVGAQTPQAAYGQQPDNYNVAGPTGLTAIPTPGSNLPGDTLDGVGTPYTGMPAYAGLGPGYSAPADPAYQDPAAIAALAAQPQPPQQTAMLGDVVDAPVTTPTTEYTGPFTQFPAGTQTGNP